MDLILHLPTSITITEPDELDPNGSVTSDYNGEDISCFGAAGRYNNRLLFQEEQHLINILLIMERLSNPTLYSQGLLLGRILFII